MTDVSQRFNKEVYQIAVSLIRKFDERVSGIPDILKLTLGEPDFNTPDHVKNAGVQAIEQNYSHYSGNGRVNGCSRSRKPFLKEKYQLSYDPLSEVLVTIGATEAISASLLAILEPGDKVLYQHLFIPDMSP